MNEGDAKQMILVLVKYMRCTRQDTLKLDKRDWNTLKDSDEHFCLVCLICSRTHGRDKSWSAGLWQTFFSTSVGSQIPLLAEMPLSVCG